VHFLAQNIEQLKKNVLVCTATDNRLAKIKPRPVGRGKDEKKYKNRLAISKRQIGQLLSLFSTQKNIETQD